jgi:hypothetical protein
MTTKCKKCVLIVKKNPQVTSKIGVLEPATKLAKDDGIGLLTVQDIQKTLLKFVMS